MKWIHSRRGPMEGEIVHTTDDGEWVDIRLGRDHQLTYMAAANRGATDYEGDVIRVRRSHLKAVDA